MLNDDYRQCKAPEPTTVNIDSTVKWLAARVENLEFRLGVVERNTSPLLPDIFDFGQALKLLKSGYHLTRKCWRNRDIKVWLDYGLGKNQADELRVMTVAGVNCVWSPNHSELLADDWMIA